MTSKDNPDEELLARYRRAGDTDAAAPSETVRSAILAESRRVADELKKTRPPFDVSRPAANDARWKITAYGTVGAALLAALLFAPRFWESQRATEVSSVPAAAPAEPPAPAAQIAAPAASAATPDTAAPAAKRESSDAAVPAPEMASMARSKPNESLQEVIVTQAQHKASVAGAEKSRQYAVPAPNNPPSVAQNYTRAPASPPPVADSAPLAAPAPQATNSQAQPNAQAALSPQAADALAGVRAGRSGALSGDALSMNADRAARTNLVQTPASLQAAAGLGDVRQTALLLDQGMAVDARDAAGRTPLMLAVVQGRLEVVRLLLARGADPNAADNAGRTPLQQAREKNLRDVAALLERAGAH